MAYIGKSPTGTGVRSRYYYTATGGETSLSGADDNSNTLVFSDGNYVDVSLNGVSLVAGTDYNTSTANTIGGLAALSASDIVEIVVYDIFTVADTVSAKNGGTFSGNVAMNGDLTVDTNTLYVDSTNNRVGVGTSSPSKPLQISNGDYSYPARITSTGGTTVGLEFANTGSGANPPVVGSKSDDIFFETNNNERMRIGSSGKVGIGTTSISSTLEIVPPDTSTIIETHSFNTSAQNHMQMRNNSGTEVGSIYVTTTSTSYYTSSDYRLKENVVADWDATTRLKQLNPVRFNFIADPDTTVDGFLAHEVQTVVPEAISGTHNEVDEEGNPVYQGIDQSKLTPLLTKALIEAVEKIEQLETRIAALENV